MTATISDAYQDYGDLLEDLDNDQTVASTVYETIMAKEQSRINLVNRIIDHKINDKIKSSFILNSTISDVIQQTIKSWYGIYTDITQKKITDPIFLLWNGDRKIFFGIFVITVACFILFVEISA
jgi:hypothetical protein